PAIERSMETLTVREFLTCCLIPFVFQIEEEDTIKVQWQDLSYAISASMDLYAARVTMTRDLDIICEEFRERWVEFWPQQELTDPPKA
ncbi:hypothetical protein J7M28_08830, partial [bacterium]|nr:hypothetical protein [bacterium]